MEIIQPMDLEAGYRSFSILGEHRLATSVKLFFPLKAGIPLLNSEAYQRLENTPGAIFDEALPKLSTEFLVIGEAQTPNESAQTSMVCRVKLGQQEKSLRILGDRFWVGGLAGMSSPLPFKKMPLNWHHSFGGKAFKLNTHGRGIEVEDASSIGVDDKLIALPNIEPKDKIITSKGQQPDPVNFCPLPQDSPLRSQYLGTYDNNWLKTRFPGYPDDFSMKAFYCASKDQRCNDFLRGGEDYELENFNHEKPLITGKLPSYRVRIFLVKKGISVSELSEHDLYEVDNQLDTVTFYPNDELGMLTYRGTIDSSTDDASQFKHMIIGYENLDQPARDKSHYLTSLIGRIHPDLNMQFALSTKDLIPDDVPCGIAQLSQNTQEQEPLQLLAQNLAQKTEQTLAQAKQESEEKLQALLASMQSEGKDTSALKAQLEKSLAQPEKNEWTLRYEALIEKIAPGSLSHHGKIDLQKIDFKAFDELAKLSKEHSEFQLQKVKDDLAQQIQQAKESSSSNITGTGEVTNKETITETLSNALTRLELPPLLPRPKDSASMLKKVQQAMDKLEQQSEKAQALGANVNRAELKPELNTENELLTAYRQGAHAMDMGTTPLHEQKDAVMRQFLARVENGESHLGSDYAGLNFYSMDLTDIDLSHCYLEQCNFSNCKLTGANLEYSILARSNFSSADLSRANLSHANMGACNFQSADLSQANLEHCEYGKSDFSHGKLVNTNLSGSINSLDCKFHHCDMTGIIFDEPSFVELDFSHAILSHSQLASATFINCNLSHCRFDSANIKAINFIECKLNQASFVQAEMENCRFMLISGTDDNDLIDCNLIECDFTRANASNCNFRDCDLSKSDFSFADLRFADFSNANAQDCNFFGSDMSQSQCMQTDFGRSDLSNCNLLEANLMKARLTAAKIKQSNCYGVEFLAATVGKTDFSGSILDATKLEDWRPGKWQS